MSVTDQAAPLAESAVADGLANEAAPPSACGAPSEGASPNGTSASEASASGASPVEATPDGVQGSRRRHDEVLADIARFAGSSLDLSEVLERIVARAAALTGADRSSIMLLDRAQEHLLPSALYGMDPGFTEGWKNRPLAVADEPLSQEVITSRRPVVVNDAARDPRTDKRTVEFFGDRSLLVAPLVSHGTVLGTLFINHVREPYQFTDDDVATTTTIANQAAIAIDNARLYGDTRRLLDQLRRSFRHAGEALAAGRDLGRNLQLMVQLAVETVDATGGAITLPDEAGRGAYEAAAAGQPPKDGHDQVEFPLVADSHPLGTLALWREAPPFDPEERELLAAFAGHIRSVIEHARLYDWLEEERKRARIAEKGQAEFTSMVSHELRTPIALIKGYVDTLLRPPVPLSPERVQRFVEGIELANDRLRRLIDNMLSASRLESDLFTGTPEPLEIHTLIKRGVSAAAMLAQGRTIRVDTSGGELWVLGDLDQLTQVLENLIGNAVKHTPDSAPVTVSAAPVDSHVRLTVRDSGPGIPPEALDLIFQKFYRVPDAPDLSSLLANIGDGRGGTPSAESARLHPINRQHGLGLGLYICRRIVEAHGGRIWAENLPEGGSAFHVELPARTTGAITEVGQAPDASEGEGNPAGTPA